MRTLLVFVLALLLSGCALFETYRPDDYLTDKTYQRIVFEPIAAAPVGGMTLLLERAKTYCAKPGGIAVALEVPATEAPRAWTIADLEKARMRWRKLQPSAGTLVVSVLFVRGSFADDPATAGYAFARDAFAIFVDVQQQNKAPIQSVTVHEMGHLLGLVNQGSSMVHAHESKDGPGHCDNLACVMAPKAPPQPFPDYDDNCKADLRR